MAMAGSVITAIKIPKARNHSVFVLIVDLLDKDIPTMIVRSQVKTRT